MNISVDLVECAYLTSAMIIEVTALGSQEDIKRSILTKPIYQILRKSDRQYLEGPPESTREHIVSACRALLNGKWVDCINYLFNDKMDKKVKSDLFYSNSAF